MHLFLSFPMLRDLKNILKGDKRNTDVKNTLN